MADENNVEMENTDCGVSCGDGSGGDCCGTSGGGGGGAWKSIIFVFIIVLAGTVAARSLLNSGADAGPCGVDSACGVSADAGQCGGGEKVACDKAGAEDEACAKKADCPVSAEEVCPFEEGEDCCDGEGEKCAGHDGHAGHAGHGDHADHDGHGHGHGHGHDHGSAGDSDACPMSSSPSLVETPCSSKADAGDADAGCCPGF